MTNPFLLSILLLSIFITVNGQEVNDVNNVVVESISPHEPEANTSTIPVHEKVEMMASESPAQEGNVVSAPAEEKDDLAMPAPAEEVTDEKGLGTEVHPKFIDEHHLVGPDQDHVGVHGEFERGVFEDDFDPWKDYEGELDEHDPFFDDMMNRDASRQYRARADSESVHGKHVAEENLDFDSEDHRLNKFDFSPSEGLQFVLQGKMKECFYEDVQSSEDHLRGAYMTLAGDPKIDVYILDPEGQEVFNEIGQIESEYDVEVEKLGVYEICFDNSRYSAEKMLILATETIESQYPVRKEHLSHLSQYASHLDVKLGKLESEQRLYRLRADRHLQTENNTNGRIAWYTSLECFTYCAISIVQVSYIKHILEQPLISRSWA